MQLPEPHSSEFFASEAGVCCYVTVRREAIRICFDAPDAPGRVSDTSAYGASEALIVATRAFNAHQALLSALFEQVSANQAKRAGQLQ